MQKPNKKLKNWKIGDFIRATNEKNKGKVHWVGMVVQLTNYGKEWPQPAGVRISLSHNHDYNITCDFHNYQGGVLHKFRPSERQRLEIRNAVEEGYSREQMDNLSYVAAVDRLNKYDRHSKTRSKSI